MAESIERETQHLSQRASAILELLTADSKNRDNHRRRVSAQTSDLGRMWQAHLESLEVASDFIVSKDYHFASFLRQFQRDANAVMHLFDHLCSAELPEDDPDRQDSHVLRVREVLSEALRLLSREQATVIPLVRRWRSTRPMPAAHAS